MSLRPNRAAAAAAAQSPYGGYAPPPPQQQPQAQQQQPSPHYASTGYSSSASPAAATSYYSPYPSPSYAASGGAGTGYGGGGGGYGGSTSGSGGYGSHQSAYGGYSAPTNHNHHYKDNGAFKDKPKKRRHNDSMNIPALVGGALTVLFFIATLHYRGKAYQITRLLNVPTIREAVDLYNRVHNDLSQVRQELRDQEKQFRKDRRAFEVQQEGWENEREALRKQVEQAQQAHEHAQANLMDHTALQAEQDARRQHREAAWVNSVQILQEYTQRESHRLALDRFGNGPHHVRFTVLLHSDAEGKPRHFLVECAPLDLMPHSVYVFLEQVVHGLWNNAWFYLNGPHVLQGGPQAEEDDEQGARALQRFRDLALDHLAFPEYAPEFPHEQYTLGFTGRPGGPDFYINKMNNTDAHGPGGQHQHHLEEFADPCFAKVIDGFDTLEMIYQEFTYPDGHEWGWFYEYPVHIVGATLLEQAAPPVHPDTIVDTTTTATHTAGGSHDHPPHVSHILSSSSEASSFTAAEEAYEEHHHHDGVEFATRTLHRPKLEEMEHQVVP